MTSAPHRYEIDSHAKTQVASAVAHTGTQQFRFQIMRNHFQRVFFASALICAVATTASAQTPVCIGSGWDHRDPVNIAEARVYARLFFEFKDSGVVSEEFAKFRFTNPAPTGAMTPFYGAEEFFKELYAHRLNYKTNPPNYYSLQDLLQDDPVVQAAFRRYATTGQFEPPFDAARPPSPPQRVRMIGYEGLDPAIRRRDFGRASQALGYPSKWPTREVFHADSLKAFPVSAGTLQTTVEPVPIYLIVNPAEIDLAWSNLAPTTGEARDFPPLDGSAAGCMVFHIAPTRLTRGFSGLEVPWPAWADEAFVDGNPNLADLALETRPWRALASTLLGSINTASALQTVGVATPVAFNIYGVSPTAWRTVEPKSDLDRLTRASRGTLVFPLFESVGLLREAENDPWKDDRNGPMSSHVESRGAVWQLGGRNSLVLAAPRVENERSPRREYVIVPETFAQLAFPVISIYKSTTWKPLAEDFEFRIGAPTTTDGLRAVCVFMTCTTEQLREIGKAMSRAKETQ